MKNLLLKISTLMILLYLQSPVSAQTFSASSEKGCDTLTVKFTYSYPSAVTEVKWNFGDNDESTEDNPQHKYAQPGKYKVSLLVNNSDYVEVADFIQVGITPVADFAFSDTLELGPHYVAFYPVQEESSLFSYSWTISEGTTENASNFTHQFDTTGKYTAQLIITDVLGCADTVTRTVPVRDNLDIPNVFTPNDDNNNDLFIINGDNKTTYSIQIFSRSGLKVFETEARLIVWDGRSFSGQKVRDGIYYYVIESVDRPISLKQTGFFYVFQ